MNNVQYIRQWLLEHNEYLALREVREEFLDVLAEFAVVFEKLAGLNPDDAIRVDEGNVRIVSGLPVENEQTEFILKLINYDMAYVDLDIVKRYSIYRFLHLFNDDFDGELSLQELRDYFGDLYDFKMRQYRDCKFDRTIYVINHKVFYADQPLTEEEIAYISKIKSTDQDQFDVDHNEDGSFSCW